jgi:hypothetical protein
MHTGIMNVAGIFLVHRRAVRTENLALHDLGKTEDGVERRPQFVAHLCEKARFGDIGALGPTPRLIRNGF